MKLSCTQENLRKSLSIVSHIAGKNTSLPILNNVLVKAESGTLKLLTTNLEIGIVSVLRGKVEEEGSVTIPAKLLNEYVALLPKERVDLNLEDQNLKIKCKNFKTTIKGTAASEFPLIPKIEKENSFTCKAVDFKKALGQVIFAASFDEARPEISGVLLNFEKRKLTITATDSYRLAEKVVDLNGSSDKERKIIIPVKTLQELLRILGENDEAAELEFYLSENQILFVNGGVELVSRIIEGQYPDYKQIIPENFKTKIITSTSDFGRVIKSASLFCKSGINDVSLKFLVGKKEMIVIADNSQLGENISSLEIESSGEDNEIVFNYRYLLDGLANIDSEKVVLEVISSANPGILRPEGTKDYTYLIMPIRQ